MTETLELTKPANNVALIDKAQFSVTEEMIQRQAEKFLLLKINGVDDSAGAAAVKAARLECRDARNTVDKEREKAKEDYLEAGRRIQESAKKLWALIEPIETHLKNEEKRIADELASIVRKRMDDRQSAREKQLTFVGGIPQIILATIQSNFVRVAEEPQFIEFLGRVENMNVLLAQQEKDRLAKEATDKIERDRLATEKAANDKIEADARETLRLANIKLAADLAEQKKALDAQAAEQKAKQDEIDAKAKEIEDAKSAQETSQIEKEHLADVSMPIEAESVGVKTNWVPSFARKPDSLSKQALDAYIQRIRNIPELRLESEFREQQNAVGDLIDELVVALRSIANKI